jgi:hypothetical protein
MLSPQQVAHFQTFGFVTLPQVFTAAERKIIDTEYETGLNLAYQQIPFTGEKRHWTMMLSPETPFFSGLPEAPRFCDVAEQLYGEDVFAVGCDANRYVGDSAWHPDHNADPTKDCYGIKIAFYLDPVNDQSGALRVIPGSHRNPMHEAVRENLAAMELAINAVPGHVCVSEPGDAVAFDLRLWHASWGGDEGRRMCTVVYYKNPVTPAEQAATRNRAASSQKAPAQYERPDDPLYSPHWVANHSGSEKRRGWLERLKEFGFIDLVAA